MFIRFDDRIINVDLTSSIILDSVGGARGKPVIHFITSAGESKTSLCFEDVPTAEKIMDDITEALRAGEIMLDLR